MTRRVIVYLVVIVALAAGLGRIYYQTTDDFRLGNLSYVNNPAWDVPTLSGDELQKLDRILAQEFHYLGKGGQSYAFSSHDGQYVLKLIKFKHIRPSKLVTALPDIPPFDQYKKEHYERKNRLLTSVMSGYHLAYTENRKESGILFLHLNRTDDLKRVVTVYDKIGVKRKLDLDQIAFVLQEKVTKSRDVLRHALARGKVGLAKKRIRQIFDLYVQEYTKGLYDRDHGVLHNTGFVGERVIRLDSGKLTKDNVMKQPHKQREDFEKVANKITHWVQANFPNDYQEVCQEMQQALNELHVE